jgi:membrane protein required for colicin V production
MTVIDYPIIFIVVISALFGIFRGFIRELLAVVGWVLAFYCSSLFSDQLAKIIPFFEDGALKHFIAYLIIFVVILVVASIIIKLLNKFIKTVGLSFSNILIGSLFGFIRGVLVDKIHLLRNNDQQKSNQNTSNKTK